MGALKSGVKSGNAEHKATGDGEGMVKALVELASFCDEQLRLKEDEGNGNVAYGCTVHVRSFIIFEELGTV